MGAGLFERYPDIEREADAVLGYSLRELCAEDAHELLAQTEYTQPALFTVGVLAYRDWIDRGQSPPDFLAGHSLGEYCALYVAGVFDFPTGLELVCKRGQLMSAAPRGAMAAVLNLDPPRIERLLADLAFANIDIANFNAPGQYILSGLRDELLDDRLSRAVEGAGGTFVRLNVSAAFHSRCMRGVAAEFGDHLTTFTFGEPRIPVIANCTARPYPPGRCAELLCRQVESPVRWHESISWLIGEGCERFEELGAGRVLTKLNEKIARDPLPIARGVPQDRGQDRPRASRRHAPHKLVFMYAGQGSQYFDMGRNLYEQNAAFRQTMQRCDKQVHDMCGFSLLATLYRSASKASPFLDITASHAALFAVGYALTETLKARGIEPEAVLGYSLGEYVASAAAGMIDWRDGLALVIHQAELLRATASSHGGLASIMEAPRLFDERPQLFGDLELAGVNAPDNFLVSGRSAVLDRLELRFRDEGRPAVRLPVSIAFHSTLIEPIRADFLRRAREVEIRSPRLPIYSATSGGRLGDGLADDHALHLWNAVREGLRFRTLMEETFRGGDDSFFVDLSATGSFAALLKHGHDGRYRCASVINRFGRDLSSLSALEQKLAALDR